LLGRSVQLSFHEDNETAIIAMENGYSPALRHLSRTHGVCLRWLAERFSSPGISLQYERSALQAADVYTKAFTVPAEWDKACRLINHLEPDRFWEDSGELIPGRMGVEHKGGVVFGYHNSNPWLGWESLRIPEVSEVPAAPAVPAAACKRSVSCPWKDSHVPWVTQDTTPVKPGAKAVDSDPMDKFFEESPLYDANDYASTAAPDSDDELSGLDELPVPGGHAHDPKQAACAGAPNSGGGGARPGALPCAPAPPRARRRIVEFCCGENSRIGRLAMPDCEVVRFTIKDDLTTEAALAKCLAAVAEPGVPVLLFGALPCTGGSPWQNLNWHVGPKTRSKIRAHRAVFRKLWRNFGIVAQACRANGGRIALEWPRRCAYWRQRNVQSFLRDYDLRLHHFDGCRFNLRSIAPSKQGKLLRKPWTLASDVPQFTKFGDFTCCHPRGAHASVEGRDTRATEEYTDSMVHLIHECWREWCAQ